VRLPPRFFLCDRVCGPSNLKVALRRKHSDTLSPPQSGRPTRIGPELLRPHKRSSSLLSAQSEFSDSCAIRSCPIILSRRSLLSFWLIGPTYHGIQPRLRMCSVFLPFFPPPGCRPFLLVAATRSGQESSRRRTPGTLLEGDAIIFLFSSNPILGYRLSICRGVLRVLSAACPTHLFRSLLRLEPSSLFPLLPPGCFKRFLSSTLGRATCPLLASCRVFSARHIA